MKKMNNYYDAQKIEKLQELLKDINTTLGITSPDPIEEFLAKVMPPKAATPCPPQAPHHDPDEVVNSICEDAVRGVRGGPPQVDFSDPASIDNVLRFYFPGLPPILAKKTHEILRISKPKKIQQEEPVDTQKLTDDFHNLCTKIGRKKEEPVRFIPANKFGTNQK
jgi:hypothetical protein